MLWGPRAPLMEMQVCVSEAEWIALKKFLPVFRPPSPVTNHKSPSPKSAALPERLLKREGSGTSSTMGVPAAQATQAHERLQALESKSDLSLDSLTSQESQNQSTDKTSGSAAATLVDSKLETSVVTRPRRFALPHVSQSEWHLASKCALWICLCVCDADWLLVLMIGIEDLSKPNPLFKNQSAKDVNHALPARKLSDASLTHRLGARTLKLVCFSIHAISLVWCG